MSSTRRKYLVAATAPLLLVRTVFTRAKQVMSLLRFKPFEIATPEGRSQERYRRIVISSVSSLFAKAVSTATYLISVPLTLEYLGRERFGLWAALSSLIGFLALTDLGVGNALVNAVTRAMGRDDRAMAQKDVSSAFAVLVLQGFLLILSFSILQNYVDWPTLFNMHSNTAKAEVGKAIAVLVAIAALQLPLAAAQRVHEGSQEGYVNNLWQAGASCAGLGGLFLVVHLRLGLPWLVVAVAGAPVLAAFMSSIVHFWLLKPWLRPRIRYFELGESGELVRTGFIFSVLAFFTFLGINSDSLVISRMLDASAVTEYAVVQRLSLVAYLFWAIVIPLWPAYGEAMSRKEFKWMQKTFERSLMVSLTGGLAVGTGLAIWGPEIIRVWIGPDLHVAPSLIYGFSTYIIISGVIGSISVVLNSGPTLRRQVWIVAIAAVTALVLKITLCTQYGVAGVIWATVIAYALFYVIPGFWIIRKHVYSVS